MANTLVYSTATGIGGATHDASVAYLFEKSYDDTSFCFICGRATDHFAEHDNIPSVFYDVGSEENETTIFTWSYVYMTKPSWMD